MEADVKPKSSLVITAERGLITVRLNMTSKYQITPEEYVKAGLLNGEIRGKAKIIHIGIELLLVAAGLVFLYLEEYIFASGLIGAVIGGYLIPFLFRKCYTPWYLKKHYCKYPAMQKPMSIFVMEDGVKFKNDAGEGTVAWSEIHKWREGKEMVLIYPAPKIYYMVPKRVSEIGDLCENLQSRVGKAT
jgi:hypothetical protein